MSPKRISSAFRRFDERRDWHDALRAKQPLRLDAKRDERDQENSAKSTGKEPGRDDVAFAEVHRPVLITLALTLTLTLTLTLALTLTLTLALTLTLTPRKATSSPRGSAGTRYLTATRCGSALRIPTTSLLAVR